MKLKYKLGITLLELVITIAVLGILASGIMIIIGRNSQGKTRDGIRKADLKNIAGAVNAYYFSNNNSFPAGCGVNLYCTSNQNPTEWITGLNSEMKTIPVDSKQPPVLPDTAGTQIIEADATDGYIQYDRLTYAPDTSGACNLNKYENIFAQFLLVVGQKLVTSTFYTYRSYLAFNTAIIPDNATIIGSRLSLSVGSNGTTTDFNLIARYFNWNPLACADWVNPASGTPANVPFYNTDQLPAAGQPFTVSFTDFTGINRFGLTQIMLTSSREESDSPPSGSEYLHVLPQGSGTYSPKLTVDYTYPTPTAGGGSSCPYRYETTTDRQDFILWGCLEIGSDEHIFNISDPSKTPNAPCPKSAYWKSNLPIGAVNPNNYPYNFCIESR